MATSSPPPPPPLPDDKSTTSSIPNGPTINQPQTAVDGAGNTATVNGTKSWKRAWSVDEMRKGATTWSLASDAGLLHYLQEFSQTMISQTHKIEQKVDGLVHDTKGISAKVQNTFNDFLMLSNTQFIENRVYDEEEIKDEEVKTDETNSQEKDKTREELETEVIPKINEAITCGLSVLNSAFVTVEITPEQMSDEEEEGNLPENLRPEPILELTDVYAHRKLPSFIGTADFHNDDLVGLADSSSEDECSEKSMESVESEEETSKDGKTSESESDSETASYLSSKSEESSSSSETEEEVVQRKKSRKDSKDESHSEDDLFAASTKEKSPKSDEDDEESDEDVNEQPRKPGVPLDFSSELSAKLAKKVGKPEDGGDDHDENDDDQEWPGDEQEKDDLFSASMDTTSSVTSKSRKKKGKSKHKKSKSRSSSQISHDSGVTAGLPSAAVTPTLAPKLASKHSEVSDEADNEWEQSGKHDDQQDDFFTSSIDTTSSTVNKSRHKHKHKRKSSRSDSQLSNASLKSDKSKKETKKTPKKSEQNSDGDLFGEEDVSSPFGTKGGMFSSGGGSGLFDEVEEDNDESKSDIMDKDSVKTNQDDGKDEKVVVKPKPKMSSSGKKLPAGAVSIFGDHGPLIGSTPLLHSSDKVVEKNVPPEKKNEKAKSGGGGGLFSDDGDDIFSSSQSSSLVSSKPDVTRASKTVDLFGDDDDADDDDNSLFSAQPTKKKEEPKSQPSKKKLPVGAVSMFGSSPPPLFNASPTDDEHVVKPSTSNTVNSAAAKESSGLFAEDDKTRSFSSEKSSSSVTPVVPVAVKPKRKTNQISLFDDQGEEEEEEDDDGDDLFTSIAPSKGMNTNKTRQKSEQPEQPAQEKKITTSKPTPKKSTISLFDDDDDEDDKDNLDIFSGKPPLSSTNKEKSTDGMPPSKQTIPKSGLFDSDDHDLFSEPKQNDQNKQEPPKNKPAVKSAKPPASTLLDTKDNGDLFSESDPLLMNQEESTGAKAVKPTEPECATTETDMENNLFTESKSESSDPLLVLSKQDIQKPSVDDSSSRQDHEEKDEEDGFMNPNKQTKIPSKPSKNLPGAVSLFGGIDIFAGQKTGKPKRHQPEGGSLFGGGDQDDLFAATSPPKQAPSVAPRTKHPKKQETDTPQVTTFSPLSQANVPVQAAKPIGAVSSTDKDSTVGKLQQKLAFNPAVMLPGAPPRKQNETSDKPTSESAAKKSLVFNPATMLPGAVPPPRKQNDVAEATFDKPVTVKTLESSAKDRVRIRAKRRPPTRQARRTAARESMNDTSLFGSAISASIPSPLSNDLTDGGWKKESLLSDSDDFLSSNSYQALDKSDDRHVNPKATQSNTLKSDSLSDNSKTIAVSSASLFDDSVDGAMSENKINSVLDTETIKENVPKTETIKENVPKTEKQKENVPEIEKQKENVPKTEKQKTAIKTTTESLFDDSAKDDLFRRSTEDFKPSSQKVNLSEDEDDLFKSNSRPLFSPPPFDFESGATASGDITINKKPKPSGDDLFSENSKFEQDIFAPLSSAVKEDEKTKENENKKEDQEEADKKSESKLKTNAKKTNVDDDLFGDTGSIFDDIPKKPKEKKKKKATTSKENIFDEPTKDSVGHEDTASVKTIKKTKGKKKVEKKGKSKISIFDDDSPNIFDDPLNATSK